MGVWAKGDVAVLQVRRSVDELHCEIIKYYGEREGTKASLRRKLEQDKAGMLAWLRKDTGLDFGDLRLDLRAGDSNRDDQYREDRANER